MHIANETERPQARLLLATLDIPEDYHADRLRWWNTNSASWSEHIDADQKRGALLARLAQKACELVRGAERPVVVDLGCGEGAFLREMRRCVPAAELRGIDFCPPMLSQAKTRSAGLAIDYDLGDLEERGFIPPCSADLVTSILAVDEMDQLESAFANISRTLAPGGGAMIVVMDPTRERQRNKGELDVWLTDGVPSDAPVLLVKTFPTRRMEPAAPYSRIVRPLDHYADAAMRAGLGSQGVEQWTHRVGIGDYSDTLTFDVLTFRKLH